MSSSELDHSKDEIYLASLEAHASHIQLHASGLSQNSSGSSFSPFSSSLIQNTPWSPLEKSKFFASLARHSRLRSDLISADLNHTKTPAEVSAYIDFLIEASSSFSSSSWALRTNGIPAAREMSDAWIEEEERLAHEIIEGSARAQVYEQSTRPRRAASRAEGVLPVRHCAPGAVLTHRRRRRKRRREGSVEDDEEEETRTKRRRLESEWTVEDLLRDLDEPTLTAIDALLEEGEEEPQNCNDEAPHPPQNSSRERCIVPSQVADPPPPSSAINPSSLSAVERLRYQKRMYMRRKRAELASSLAEAPIINATLSRLTPGPKHKRRQSRRRSLSSGLAVTGEETEQNQPSEDGTHQLNQKETRSVARVREIQDILMTESPFSVKARLKDDGLDVFKFTRLARLHSQSLSSNRSSQLQEPPPLNLNATRPSISLRYGTLCLLRGYLESFVLPIIHRAIVLAEEEATAKDRTKAWRGKCDEISAEHLIRALEIGRNGDEYSARPEETEDGAGLPSRLRAHLRSRSGDADGMITHEDDNNDDDNDEIPSTNNTYDSSDDEDDHQSDSSRSSHRSISPPPSPSPSYPASSRHSSHANPPPFTESIPLAFPVFKKETTYLNDLIKLDARKVRKVRLQEEKLARKDKGDDRLYENALWAMFGIEGGGGGGDEIEKEERMQIQEQEQVRRGGRGKGKGKGKGEEARKRGVTAEMEVERDGKEEAGFGDADLASGSDKDEGEEEGAVDQDATNDGTHVEAGQGDLIESRPPLPLQGVVHGRRRDQRTRGGRAPARPVIKSREIITDSDFSDE